MENTRAIWLQTQWYNRVYSKQDGVTSAGNGGVNFMFTQKPANHLAAFQRNQELGGCRASPPFLDHCTVPLQTRRSAPLGALACGPVLGPTSLCFIVLVQGCHRVS